MLATVALACGVAIGIPSVQAANQVLFASNAGKVNGIAAARAPKANTLLPLNNQAQLPASVLPNITKLKAGQTITGVIGGGFKATAARDLGSATASFPIKAPKAIAREAVGMASTASESPFCTGDVGAPTAPQGILCVYPANDQFVNVRQDCTPGPFPNCTSGEGVFVVELGADLRRAERLRHHVGVGGRRHIAVLRDLGVHRPGQGPRARRGSSGRRRRLQRRLIRSHIQPQEIRR